MIPPLEVFAIENGEHKWLACAETQAKAPELIGNRCPGSYFVFSQETGKQDLLRSGCKIGFFRLS